MENKRILIIVAHPDDEAIGMGGSIKKLSDQGHTITVLFCTTQATTPHEGHDFKVEWAERASRILGVSKTLYLNKPCLMFDTIPQSELINDLRRIIADIDPEILFTHYEDDTHIDHRMVAQSAIVAARPKDNNIKQLYMFEMHDSSNWNWKAGFQPNVFIDISEEQFKAKTQAIDCYESERVDFPHPRSIRALEANAVHWGSLNNVEMVESFKLIRALI